MANKMTVVTEDTRAAVESPTTSGFLVGIGARDVGCLVRDGTTYVGHPVGSGVGLLTSQQEGGT